MKKLRRTHFDRVLGGVCGGISEYMNIDPMIVRLIFVLLSLFGFGITFIIYIILWIMIPVDYKY